MIAPPGAITFSTITVVQQVGLHSPNSRPKRPVCYLAIHAAPQVHAFWRQHSGGFSSR
jgi:hypothetical protein